MNYSVEYYKEKDTDPMVFLQRFRCTTEPIGGGTEEDEEGELVNWDAAVAAIEIAKKQLGWHPASELPRKPANGIGKIIVITFDDEYGINNYADGWNLDNIKWWCYPPKEK